MKKRLPELKWIDLPIVAGTILFFAYFFYRALYGVIFLSPLAVPLAIRRSRINRQKYETEMASQFKEAMNSVLIGLRAGYSAENAFRSAYQEMVFLYGKKAMICQELWRIDRGLDNRIPLEGLIDEMAERTRSEEIGEFAEVFCIAKKSGGNMSEILTRTISVIQSRIDVEAEIGVIISSRKMEQSIMNIVPFAIIFYIELTNDGFFDPLYHNLFGIGVMTICLAVYLAGIVLSERIVSIRV